MKNLLKGTFALLLIAITPSARAYTNPGLPLTATDLNRIKANLNVEPWKSGYASLAADGVAQLNWVPNGPYVEVGRTPDVNRNQYIGDMRSIYEKAVIWWMTGDSAYADKAIALLDGYATTNTIMSGEEIYLTVGDEIEHTVAGADILRSYSGWTPTIDAHVKNYFANVLYPLSGLPGKTLRSANQGAEELIIGMSTAMFCQDNALLAAALDAYRNDICGGLSSSLPNGEVGDTGRDQGHTWGQLFHLAWIAQAAWNQGIDLFGEKNNRLLAASEFFAQYNLGLNPTWINFGTCYGNYGSVGGSPSMSNGGMEFADIIYSAYVTRKGLSAPYTLQWLNAKNSENGYSFVFRNTGGAQPPAPPTAATDPGLIAPPATTSLTSVDLGTVGLAGSSTYNNGTWTVVGSGADMWGGSDNGQFAYKTLTGNGTIIAKVTSQQSTNSSAKAGIMIRDSLSANANCYAVWTQPGSSLVQFFERASTSPPAQWEWSQNHSGLALPEWLKLIRNGDNIYVSHSQDGVNWTALVMQNNPMTGTLYIGLCVTSHDNTQTSTATFTNVGIDANGGSIPDGTYQIVNLNSGKVFDVASNGLGNGSNVQQYHYHGGFNQLWTLTQLGGGKYRILGLQSAKSLDITAGSNADGANVEIWTPSPTAANQQYTFTPTSSGYNRITPVNSGKSVEVTGSSVSDGGNVDQSTYTGGNNQQWSLQTP